MSEQEFTWNEVGQNGDNFTCRWNGFSLWVNTSLDAKYAGCWEWEVLGPEPVGSCASGRSRELASAQNYAERFAEIAKEHSTDTCYAYGGSQC